MKKYRQEKTYKNVIGVSALLVFLFILASVMACKSPHPELRGFASSLAEDLTIKVCDGKNINKDMMFSSCGQRDVKFDADSGLCVYINVYGVTEKKEVERLIDFVKKYRGEEYKVIPIKIVFYADLEKSKIVYKEKIKGEK